MVCAKLKDAEVEIGGQRIDKHYSEWMYIWNELTMSEGKKEAYFDMVGGSGSLSGGKFLELKTNLFNIDISPVVRPGSIHIIAKDSSNNTIPGSTVLEITPVDGGKQL